MEFTDVNTSLQALLAVTLIIGAISGMITWIAGSVANSKFDRFKADLLMELGKIYATKGEVVAVASEVKTILAAIQILKEGLTNEKH